MNMIAHWTEMLFYFKLILLCTTLLKQVISALTNGADIFSSQKYFQKKKKEF